MHCEAGPAQGLALLDALDADLPIRRTHRLEAARAHLLEIAGSLRAALAVSRAAFEQTADIPERRYL